MKDSNKYCENCGYYEKGLLVFRGKCHESPKSVSKSKGDWCAKWQPRRSR